MTQGPIVLLTDFGAADPYPGILKGVILSLAPDARIVDLTHGIEPQNILQGAYVLRSSVSYFPDRSIFLCIVDPGVGTSRDIVCVKTGQRFFIGPDNGLLTLAVKNQKAEIRSVRNPKYFISDSPSPTFHGRDIIAPLAARLLQGAAKIFANLGPLKPRLAPLAQAPVTRLANRIRGKILYFDHFGNAITNIQYSDGPKNFWNHGKVFVKAKALGLVRKSYLDGPPRLCALWNSSQALEIALPCGSARRGANLKSGDAVEVKG